jgi:hypothetical protein
MVKNCSDTKSIVEHRHFHSHSQGLRRREFCAVGGNKEALRTGALYASQLVTRLADRFDQVRGHHYVLSDGHEGA